MGRRLLGAVLFLAPAMLILQIAGRLASEGREGWGWFLMAGCAACSISLNLWTGELATPPARVRTKPDPTDDLDDYPSVIEAAAGKPVLVRGGGRAPDDEILVRTEAVMQRGARGIVYGRNVIQHEYPAAMTRALMAVVHEGVTASDALGMLHG